jgi:hypothetical protein
MHVGGASVRQHVFVAGRLTWCGAARAIRVRARVRAIRAKAERAISRAI